MSIGECLIILLVALIVIGPQQLPQLSRKLVQVFKALENARVHFHEFWREQVNQQTLKDNEEKAKHSDVAYQQSNELRDRSD
jgi:Sec-independent protein translocase protein TatA